MILGASRIQLPAIENAKSRGYYVIACDMNPNSMGKDYADEFYPVSTTEYDEILEIAIERKIEGIMTYAADAAAPTVAYVANEMGLPSNPYESVLTLARKDLFRKFLREKGYYTPTSEVYDNWRNAMADIKKFTFPIILKPCDSAGSRGAAKITNINISKDDFSRLFTKALSYSRVKKVVIEDFIERSKYQIAGDGFVVNGELVFRCFANEHFNETCNTLVPIGESFPSIYSENVQESAHEVLQSIFSDLSIQFGAFNFDFMITSEGDIFIIEIGPRNGGNLIPQVTKYGTGVDMIEYTISAALGEDCSSLKMFDVKGCFSSYMIHSKTDGIFKELKMSEELKKNILEYNVYIEFGDSVNAFNMAGAAFGEMILKFSSMDEMLFKMDNMDSYLEIILDN